MIKIHPRAQLQFDLHILNDKAAPAFNQTGTGSDLFSTHGIGARGGSESGSKS